MSPSAPASASARNFRSILPVCFSAEGFRSAPARIAFAPKDFGVGESDMAGEDFHIFVAASGKIQDHHFIFSHFWRSTNKLCQGVRGLKRGNNSFGAR